MEILKEKKPRSGRANNARPHGTKTTEPSDFVARLKEASGLTLAAIGTKIGATEKTVWRYENEGIIPAKGAKRDGLNKLAKQYGVAIGGDK